MADSDLQNLTRVTPDRQHFPPGRQQPGQQVRVERVTGALEILDRPTRVEGEVVGRNEDGTIRIRTPLGDIDIRLRAPDRMVIEGQKLEIDLAAGSPPKQAVIRPAPSAPAALPPEQPSGVPRTSQPPPPLPGVPVPPPVMDAPVQPAHRPPETILSPEIVRLVQDQLVLPVQPQSLGPGDAVRLLLIPAAVSVSAPMVRTTADNNVPSSTQRAELPPPAASFPSPPALQTGQVDKIAAPVLPIEKSLFSNIVAADIPTPSPSSGLHRDPASLAGDPVVIVPESQRTPDGGMVSVQKAPVLQALQGKASGPVFFPESNPAEPEVSSFQPRATLPVFEVSDLVFPLRTIVARIAVLLPPGANISGMTTQAETTAPGMIPKAEHSIIDPAVTERTDTKMIFARVISVSEEHLPHIVLTIPGRDDEPQHFIIQTRADNLVPGMLIGLEMQTQETAGASPVSVVTAPQPFSPVAAWEWPVLDEIIRTLQQHTGGPQIVQNIVNTLPNAAVPARIAAAGLFLLAAIRAGDVAGWLGDRAVDTLRRIGRGDVVERAARELTSSGSRTTAEPGSSQEWRTLSLPVFYEDHIHKFFLHYRQGQDGEGEEGAKGKTSRFIFDLNLPRMGEVQLDGLHRGKQLDLIVRTFTPISQQMQQAMKQRYVRALEQTELTGALSFQGRPEQFVRIEAEGSLRGILA